MIEEKELGRTLIGTGTRPVKMTGDTSMIEEKELGRTVIGTGTNGIKSFSRCYLAINRTDTIVHLVTY